MCQPSPSTTITLSSHRGLELSNKFQDLTGKTFGNWEVLYITNRATKAKPKSLYMCRCVCGREKEVGAQELRNGKSKSCGCIRRSNIHLWRKGVKHTPETIEKIKAAKREYLKNKRPEDMPNWKGGKTPLIRSIRTMTKFYEWRDKVFERDNYHCRYCGKPSNSDLNAHHLIHLNRIVMYFDLETIEDVHNNDLLWDIGNGLTLCKECHDFLHLLNGY